MKDKKNTRLYGKNISIDEKSIKKFYYDRSKKYDEQKPYISMLLQDSNPGLAKERDKIEKELVLSMLNVSEDDRVLDVGCGIGRWAEALVSKIQLYHGTDLCESLISIASKRFSSDNHVSFQTIGGQDAAPEYLNQKPPYSLIMSAGVLQYLNDEDCYKTLRNIALCSADKARVFIRVPIALQTRMTLDRHWSDDLKQEYSAIYRTQEEYLQMIDEILLLSGFAIDVDQPLYPPELNNRAETRQHIFIMSR